MKHLKESLIAGLIVVLCILFFVSATLDFSLLGQYARVLIFPFLLLYYTLSIKNKNLYFLSFLCFLIIAELSLFLAINFGLLKKFGMTIIYTGTLSYILSYVSLLIFIVSKVKLKVLFKRFPLHSIVLSLFGLYLLYALDKMVTHHGVASMHTLEYVLAVIYNIAIILVLIFSLLSYLYLDTRKSLLLFISCLCLVFSELVQTAYYFMAREGLLNLVYTSLLSLGFLMLYVYMAFKNKVKSSYELIEEGNDLQSAIEADKI